MRNGASLSISVATFFNLQGLIDPSKTVKSLQKQVEKLVNAILKLEEKLGKLQDEQLIFTTQQKVSYVHMLRIGEGYKNQREMGRNLSIGRPEQCLENIAFRKLDVLQ